ncbi:hypothetical protein P0L94_07500 [Microbacter sp. GSS18]|nr:hypothetical protein P0L94_07500 [Microbacter sp. GSS18]
MKALVISESMWGNTHQVADAIAAGLAERMEVDTARIDDAPGTIADDVDLVVAGGPTHGFSMSRESTRSDAANRGAEHPSSHGLRDWLEHLPADGGKARIATFDTHVEQKWVPGSAAKAAASEARHHHLSVIARESFYVHGYEGPLLDGEIDRAQAWGRHLADLVTG